MDLPEVSLDMLEKPQFLNKQRPQQSSVRSRLWLECTFRMQSCRDFYADGMPQCRTATSHQVGPAMVHTRESRKPKELQVFEPASWPHTPGRWALTTWGLGIVSLTCRACRDFN